MVATLNKKATHEIVQQGLIALRNLEHRGASGAEVNSGDGAGILIRIPDQFYRDVVSFELGEPGSYATGIAFTTEKLMASESAEMTKNNILMQAGVSVLAQANQMPSLALNLLSGR